jgi:hypothetical protein
MDCGDVNHIEHTQNKVQWHTSAITIKIHTKKELLTQLIINKCSGKAKQYKNK